MKKIIFILLLLFTAQALAQDVDTTLTFREFYKDTMTATIDTIDVYFGGTMLREFDSYTITAFTASSTDTLTVWVQDKDLNWWTQTGLTDISTGSAATSIIATTTKVAYKILAPEPMKIRVLTADGVVTAMILISGKR